jgi:hypothetical protein
MKNTQQKSWQGCLWNSPSIRCTRRQQRRPRSRNRLRRQAAENATRGAEAPLPFSPVYQVPKPPPPEGSRSHRSSDEESPEVHVGLIFNCVTTIDATPAPSRKTELKEAGLVAGKERHHVEMMHTQNSLGFGSDSSQLMVSSRPKSLDAYFLQVWLFTVKRGERKK